MPRFTPSLRRPQWFGWVDADSAPIDTFVNTTRTIGGKGEEKKGEEEEQWV